MIYKLGKALGNKQLGYIAAILLTINEFAIYTSQDARPYSIILLAIILSFLFVSFIYQKPKYQNRYLLWFISRFFIKL